MHCSPEVNAVAPVVDALGPVTPTGVTPARLPVRLKGQRAIISSDCCRQPRSIKAPAGCVDFGRLYDLSHLV